MALRRIFPHSSDLNSRSRSNHLTFGPYRRFMEYNGLATMGGLYHALWTTNGQEEDINKHIDQDEQEMGRMKHNNSK